MTPTVVPLTRRDPTQKADRSHGTADDHRAETLSPSLVQDLRGAAAPGRTTWRETGVAWASGALFTVGVGLLAAAWRQYRSRPRLRT